MGIWITRLAETASEVTLKVEGQVIGKWVSVLANECEGIICEGKDVSLDFAGVTYVNSSGIELLRDLRTRGLCVLNVPPLLEDLFTDCG